MNFEFSRSLNFGQYLPIQSVITRLDPRSRVMISILTVAALTITTHLNGLLFGFGFVLIGLVLSRIPLKYALKSLLPPLPFLLLLAALQFFINPYPDTPPIWFHWLGMTFSMVDLLASLRLLLRFASLIIEISLVSYCLSTSELIHSLESLLGPFERIGLPTYDLVMVIQITLRFIPYLGQAAERIAKAQASRGADWGSGKGGLLTRVRRVLPLIVPLFMVSLRRAENLALAMDARGYGGRIQRTSLVQFKFKLRDSIALVLALMAVGLIVWL